MDQAVKVEAVIQDYLERAALGETIDADEVISRHPDLMPALGEELRKARRILQAVQAVPPTASERSAPPPEVPDYDLLRPIGCGGCGEVWLAGNRHVPGRYCAVKLVPQAQAAELDGIRQYQRLVGSHPHLLPIEHVGVAGSFLYYTMPLADDARGGAGVRPPADYEPFTLQRYLRRQAPLPPHEVLAIADQLLAALEALHATGLLHRDVKPGNVLRVEGVWRLGDVGLMTSCDQDEPARGTCAFWPPEGPHDRTADLYALGKTLYLLLTGAALERFPDFAQGALGVPSDDGRARALRALILRACHDDPARRFATAGAMRQAVGRLRDNRRPWRRVGVAAAAVVVIAGAALVLARGMLSGNGPHMTSLAAAVPLNGWIDVRVWEGGNARRDDLSLKEEGALPLRANDGIRIEAALNRPAYLYIVWIDADGQAAPVYPWRPGRWQDRPAAEAPAARLSLPAEADRYWPIKPGPAGMETLLLLVRETPLPRDVDLRPLLAGLPHQAWQHPRAAIWFENGAVARNEPERGPNFFDVRQKEDPVLQAQQRIHQRLQRLFAYSRAVSFANRGE
jgi:hypothetical protein